MKTKYIGIAIAMLLLTGCGADENASAGGTTAAQSAVTTSAVTTQSETTAETTSTTALQTTTATTSSVSASKPTEAPKTTAVQTTAKTTAQSTALTTGAPVPKSESAGMEQAAAEFLDAVVAKDKARVAEILRIKDYRAVMESTQKFEGDDEAVLEQLLGNLDKSLVTSYRIKDCTRAGAESLLHIPEMLAEYKQEAKQENDTDRLAALEQVEAFCGGITDAAFVNAVITLTDDVQGTNETDFPMMVVCHDGKWRADMLSAMVVSTIEMSKKIQDVGTKTAAKSTYNAVQAALFDMDSRGLNISMFNGKTIVWTGKDFENVKNTTEINGYEGMKDALRVNMKNYFEDIIKLEEIRIKFDANGKYDVTIQRKGKTGTYPE